MDERKRLILQAIVQDYIATAEPVGSRTVARRYLSQFSAATIRNEMADLEEMGMLAQPHTSAGRIPSEKGYRYYVDNLLHNPVLAKTELTALRNEFASGIQAMDDIIQQTSSLLGSLTQYMALVSGPSQQQSMFHRIQLVEIGSGQAIAVLVTDSGYVVKRMIQVPKDADQQWLNQVSDYLSQNLRGVPVQQLALGGLIHLRHDIMGRFHNFTQIVDLVLALLHDATLERMHLGSPAQILTLPEFQDLNRMRGLLSLIEEGEHLQSLFEFGNERHNKVHIRIGSENALREVDNLSLVSAAYGLRGKKLGYLAVLGPTRMDYARTVAIVRELSALLNEALARNDKETHS